MTVTAERRDSNGQRQGTRELKVETNSQEADGLKPQTDRDREGVYRRREESEQREKAECEKSLWIHSEVK